jgi:MSHA biogenesis protein MshP
MTQRIRIRHRRALPQRRCAGIGLVTAIFLVVVLTGLAVALVGISGSQQASSALDVQGARAYQAARAGIEWGLYQNMRLGGLCQPTASFALPEASTLNGFVVTVTCSSVAAPAGSPATLTRYTITATGCYHPAAGTCPGPSNNSDYVERRITVSI